MTSDIGWAEKRDWSASPPNGASGFGAHADSPCIFCSSAADTRTAEQLYASSEWDYYYCYRCRGWFRRFYRDPNVFVPVKDRMDIRFLTWHYAMQVQSMYEMKRMGEGMRTFWRFVERRLGVPGQATA